MNADSSSFSSEAGEIKKASSCAMLFGILMIILGCMAVGSPLIAGGAVAIYVGIFLVVGGVFELVGALSGTSSKSRGWALLSGVLSLVCGVYLLARPLSALLALTLLLAIYFVLDGISRIILALQSKPEPGWGVCLFSGIVTLLLGFMIWRQWPVSGAWAIGVLFGIRMIFAGWSMLAVGSVGRAVAKEVTS